MVGYPVYNNSQYVDTDKIFLSDSIVEHSGIGFRCFLIGFSLSCSLAPTAALADDNIPLAGNEIKKFITEVPANQTAAGKAVANTIAFAVCGKAGKCAYNAIQAASPTVIDKAAETGNMTILGVATCTVMAGWCIGQIVDRTVRRAL